MRAPEIGYRCPKRWDELEGEGGRRHCGACDRAVHDVSSMSARRARAFLAEQPTERRCIAFLRDAAGNLVLRSARPRPAWLRGILALVSLALPALAGCGEERVDRPAEPSPKDDGAQDPGDAERALLEFMGYTD